MHSYSAEDALCTVLMKFIGKAIYRKSIYCEPLVMY